MNAYVCIKVVIISVPYFISLSFSRTRSVNMHVVSLTLMGFINLGIQFSSCPIKTDTHFF